MKAVYKIKLNGQEPVLEFETINEVMIFLNRGLYYCEDLWIMDPMTKEPMQYWGMEDDDVKQCFKDITEYNLQEDFIDVVQSWEPREETENELETEKQ